jgi:hypothetical protein
MTTQQQTFPIDFKKYPIYDNFKTHTFRNFDLVYNDLKNVFAKINPPIKIDEHNSIKGLVLNQNPNRIIHRYNDLLSVLKHFIESLNTDIETIARKRKSGAQIDEKGNNDLVERFKSRRSKQSKCIGDKYLVPGMFTKVTWDDSSTLDAQKNSLAVNNILFTNIQNCFGTLKTMILAMITQALGDNGNIIMQQHKSSIDAILAKEFPSRQTTSYGRQYGGVRKSNKKYKSRSISRKRSLKKNKMRK